MVHVYRSGLLRFSKRERSVEEQIDEGLSESKNSPVERKINNSLTKINIVTQFPVITNGSDRELVLLRQNEYVETLKKNLLHPQVERIHLLLEKHRDGDFIEGMKLRGSEKIIFYLLNRRMFYGDAFHYVSRFLMGKTAVILNADCHIGEGFEKLDSTILQKTTIYSLTRHETQEAIRTCKAKDLCSADAKYIGSHDAFVLHLSKPLPGPLLQALMVRPDIAGVEQFVIFSLRSIAGFKVKNPCRIVYIYHNHCSNLRHAEHRLVRGKRFNSLYLTTIPRWRTNAPFSGL